MPLLLIPLIKTIEAFAIAFAATAGAATAMHVVKKFTGENDENAQ